jgi:LPS export ABC transporter protein LptC
MKLLPSAFRAIKVIAAAGLLSSCGSSDLNEAERITLDQQEVPVETGKDITVIYTDSARLQAEVMANTMNRYKKENESYLEMPDGVIAYFYNDKEERSSTLTANHGVRYTGKGKTVVRDSVVVVNRKGDTLRTERMVWNERKNFIRSEKEVTVKTSEEIINARGFRSNPSFTEYEFYDIQGTVAVEE